MVRTMDDGGEGGRRRRGAATRFGAAAALLGLALLLPVAAGAAEDEGPYGTGAAATQVDSFNGTMRGIYAKARQRLGAAARPVIIVGGDEVTLLTADGSDSRHYTPPVYHRLKAVDHVVLGLVGAVAPALQGLEGGDDWRQDLQAIATAIAGLEPQMGALGLSAEQEARQRRMLAESRDYIAAALQLEQPERGAFVALMARIKPLWLADAADAARAQLQRLDAVVDEWRAQLDPQGWARLHVLVTGPRNPRAGNLQVAYFVRLLDEPGPGGRVIYTENLFDPEQALRLLDVAVMDRDLSALVFGDRFRMDEDLLGFAAGTEIDALLSGETAE